MKRDIAKLFGVVLVALIAVTPLFVAGCSSQSKAAHSESAQSEGRLEASDAPASGVGSSPNSALDEAVAARINTDVQAIAESSGMQVGVAVVDPETEMIAGYQGDAQMPSASMIKLVIAAAFLEDVKAGKHALNDTYTLQYDDIVGGTGVLGGYGAGAEITYGEILEKMISASDNTGANILTNAVGGMDAVNREARKLKLTQTQMNRLMMDTDAIANGIENYTSANDMAAVLAMVQNGTLVDEASSALVLSALENQQDAGGILGGLPAGTQFAHKTGALTTVRHDGGIVKGSHPYVLVVLCGGAGFNEQGAYGAMASVARAVNASMAG